MKCPKCGKMNDDDWPITVDGEVMWGGCQECWEIESDAAWWDAVESVHGLYQED